MPSAYEDSRKIMKSGESLNYTQSQKINKLKKTNENTEITEKLSEVKKHDVLLFSKLNELAKMAEYYPKSFHLGDPSKNIKISSRLDLPLIYNEAEQKYCLTDYGKNILKFSDRTKI